MKISTIAIYRQYKLTWILVCTSVLLGGCGVFDGNLHDSTPVEKLSAQERQARLQQLVDWGLTGRISVRSSQDGANATLTWEQNGANSEINLYGAFGIGAVRIIQKPDQAILYRSGQKPLYGSSAEQLLLWELGLKIPLRGLSLWLRGLQGEGTDAIYDSYGRLRSLRYTDVSDTHWAATFERYREVHGNQLPVRMRVEGGDITIKLNTQKWNTEVPKKLNTDRLRIPGVTS